MTKHQASYYIFSFLKQSRTPKTLGKEDEEEEDDEDEDDEDEDDDLEDVTDEEN